MSSPLTLNPTSVLKQKELCGSEERSLFCPAIVRCVIMMFAVNTVGVHNSNLRGFRQNRLV